MASIILLPIILAVATSWLFLLTVYAPISGPELENVQFPGNLDELKALSLVLEEYFQSHSWYVILLFVSAYLYKQAFAVPGSVFLNVLAGAIFGLLGGFPLVCLLSATGASLCFLLSRSMGRKYINRYFPDKVKQMQTKVLENDDRLLYFLLFIRLFPMSPNWFINIAAPVLNIPLHLFFLSVFIGLMPYNFICVETGVILREVNAMDDIFSVYTLIKLAAIAIVALLPTFLKKRAKEIAVSNTKIA